MQVFNDVYPSSSEQLAGLMEKGPEGPIFMVNLLKFKEKAEYEDGRATTLSGRDAYQIYGKAVMALLPKFGGMGVFAGDVTYLSLGRVEDLWDEVAIAAYPDRGSMVRMSMSDEWREIAVHRTAGLEGQLNIETVLPAGARPAWLEAFAAQLPAGA
ncbi:MAG: DUF1330 domain-containing protein [Hyphomonadaceae bacterium]